MRTATQQSGNKPLRQADMSWKPSEPEVRFRVMVGVPATKEEYQAWQLRARDFGLSFSAWMRRLAMEELKRRGRSKK